MKKTIILCALAIASISNSFAQTTKTDKIFKTYRFSLFAGPTFNSLRPTASLADGYNVTKVGGKTGFSFGLNADYNITERYTLFTGIGMDWRGGGINSQLPSTTASIDKYVRGANVKYSTQYLTIPVGLKMTAATFDKFKIQALAGFDLGILLSQKGNYTFTTSTFDTSKNAYTTMSMSKVKLGGVATVVPITFGWSIGVGGEYDLNGKNAVTAHIIYRNGFMDVTSPKSNDAGSKFSDGNVRSNTLAFKFGYIF